MNPTGSIEIIYGPMFSGKSSELLRKIRRFEHARKRCLVANYSHDNRYSLAEEMATHDK
jgi:thymidine kinase